MLNLKQVVVALFNLKLRAMRLASNFLIFLVDDDKMFLKSLEHYIQHIFTKTTIKTFSTGEECINYLHLKPDVILLDYILNSSYPDAMDGIKVLTKIKETEPEIVVVMFSAQDHIDVAVNTMKHGAFDYIIKNNKIFIRVQNAIKNVMYTLSLREDARSHKRKIKWFTFMLILVLLFIIYMQIYLRAFIAL